uniref:UBIQUITIN_CONJUGAT_2 domain-containing protein n=1 Tax=Steinernema glaseri TaxID=37863 RepID=A0A1I8AW25_9BILA
MAAKSGPMVRINTELKRFAANPPEGMSLDLEKTAEDAKTWFINVKAAQGTIYEGEEYVLRVKFSDDYPFKAPEVVFVSEQVPCNPHVYSNGHICISTLGEGWSPTLNIQSICVGILSMLSSCKSKRWPVGNDTYSKKMKDKAPDYRYFNGTYNDGAC